MIHLERLNEPDALARHKAVWLERFLATGKDRPVGTNGTYGHTDVLEQLNSISHNKCFYCERSLNGTTKTIDHNIEITCDKSKTFEWTNLYLSCDNCQGKIRHNEIPVETALDPFRNTNEEIENHITFEDEIIRINNNSPLGDTTIRKFRLNSERLDFVRLALFKQFYKDLVEIQDTCKRENNRDYSDDEKERLRRYGYTDHPFSLMFKVILRKRGLI